MSWEAEVTVGRIQLEGHARAHIKSTGEDVHIPESIMTSCALQQGDTFVMVVEATLPLSGRQVTAVRWNKTLLSRTD